MKQLLEAEMDEHLGRKNMNVQMKMKTQTIEMVIQINQLEVVTGKCL